MNLKLFRNFGLLHVVKPEEVIEDVFHKVVDNELTLFVW